MVRVSLDEALQLFAENNLELRLSRSRALEAAGLARQARAFPNPTASVTREPLSRNDQGYSETYVNLTQRFEISGKRGARADAADWLLVAAEALIRADSIRLAFEVKQAFVETGMAEDHLAVTEQVVEVFRQGERNAVVREAEGDISVYDLRRLRIERVRYETLLADAALAASVARRGLALLILPDAGGLPAEMTAAEVGPGERLDALPTDPVSDLTPERAVSRRPEAAAAAAEVMAARAGDRVARAVRIPDITATGGYKRQYDGFSGAFLGLSVPLPLFDRRSGDIDAAGARVRAAEEQRTLTRRRIEADIHNAIQRYRSLRERSTFLQENLLADSPNILEIAQVAYDAGEMTLVELLDAAEALRDARMAEARLRADLWIAFFDVERARSGFDTTALQETTSTETGR
jgi:cobalt-zinc-cadmium efflux system outer membrane protein